MKKVIFRILAFGLDTLLVSLVAYCLAQVSFINPTLDHATELNESYIDVAQQYTNLLNEDGDNSLSSFLEDKVLDEDEIKTIEEEYPTFKDFAYVDGYEALDEIDADVQNAMEDYITDTMTEYVNKYSYESAKANKYQTILVIVISVLYFGVIQWLLKGQTLFKKVFRLRVVNNKDNSKEVPLWSYLVRSVLVSELIFSVIEIILASTMKQSLYVSSYNIVTELKYIYELAFLVVMIFRDDARSVHDLILGTSIVRYDKQGNVVEEHLFNVPVEEVKEVKEVKDVTPKEENKTTTKKKTTRRKSKEFVEAEKVADEKDSNKDN